MIYCHGCYPLRSSRAPLLLSFRFPVIVFFVPVIMPFRLNDVLSVAALVTADKGHKTRVSARLRPVRSLCSGSVRLY